MTCWFRGGEVWEGRGGCSQQFVMTPGHPLSCPWWCVWVETNADRGVLSSPFFFFVFFFFFLSRLDVTTGRNPVLGGTRQALPHLSSHSFVYRSRECVCVSLKLSQLLMETLSGVGRGMEGHG